MVVWIAGLPVGQWIPDAEACDEGHTVMQIQHCQTLLASLVDAVALWWSSAPCLCFWECVAVACVCPLVCIYIPA